MDASSLAAIFLSIHRPNARDRGKCLLSETHRSNGIRVSFARGSGFIVADLARAERIVGFSNVMLMIPTHWE